jgi:hypothetical protein
MEHHRCFTIYITRTQARRVSDTVFFKHQTITNPQVSPEALEIQAAQALTSTIKETVSQDNETVEALTKVSEMFAKIAATKAALARARIERNHH